MNSSNHLQPFLRPITWAVIVIFIGMLALLPTQAMNEARRVALLLVYLIFSVSAFIGIRAILPRPRGRAAVAYGGIILHSLLIAAADYLFEAMDLSPLYFLRIIASAMIWDRPAALFSAFLASLLQPIVALAHGMSLADGQVQFIIRAGAYFVSALLVSELSISLTARWRVSAREADHQREDIARRNAELEALQIELRALADLSHSLAETMNLDEMFRTIEKQVRANLPQANAGALLIYDRQSDALRVRASFGFSPEILAQMNTPPGESAPGRVFLTNRARRLSGREAIEQAAGETGRLENQMQRQASAQGELPQSNLCVPLHTGADVLGVIVLDNFKSAQAFTEQDLQLLEAIADRAALAIRNAQLFESESKRATQLNALTEVSHRVNSILDLEKLLPTIVKLIRLRFNFRYVHLFLNEPERGLTALHAGDGPVVDPLEPGSFILNFDQGMVGWVAAHGELLLANDVTQEPRYVSHASVPDTRAEVTIPIRSSTRLIGVLDVQSEKLNAFESSDIATLQTLASQVAIAIENAQLYGELREQAQRDSLTQVYNHGYFLARLNQEARVTRENGRMLSLIMVDIDYFKEYNDQYGHVVGDQVLVTMVQAIRLNVKHSDLVGRWGGEEFGIVLLGADGEHALIVAERIRTTLASMRVEKEGRVIAPPTVSQGIATLPTHAKDAATLIDLADAALYRAKAQGRDQVRVTE
ncbi:MAG: diguanylate cyclase [Chloroflexi bacterium]|nr:diguanylate cyclase [Chloroflexota bacterium]